MEAFKGNAHLSGETRGLYEREVSAETVAASAGIALDQVTDFSLNMNPFGPPAASRLAAADSLSKANAYPPLDPTELRNSIAAWHQVSADSLFFGCGLDEVIKLLIHAWTNDGERVLIHIPTFPRYALEADARGASLRSIEGKDPWSIPLTEFRQALGTERVALAFVCTPNNPTSATLGADELEHLVADFAWTQFVIDEALIYPSDAGAVPLVARYPNVAVLRTFSKYFGLAGLRIGYAVADPARLAKAEFIRPPFNLSTPGVAAAIAALHEPTFLQESHTAFAVEVENLRCQLKRFAGCRVHAGNSNMVLLEFTEANSTDVTRELARRGLVVVDGRTFAGLERLDSIRISLLARPANDVLLAALADVLERAG